MRQPGAILVKTFGMAPGDAFEQHTHDEHQLAWAASGVLTAAAVGGTWLLPPTRALWIPAGIPHRVAASGRTRMRALYLRPDRCSIDWPAPQPVTAGPLLAELIGYLADGVLDAPRRARAEAVVVDLLEPVTHATIKAPRPIDARAAAVADALTLDPSNPATLEQWGHQVGASARTLARAFLHDTGLPFGRWRAAVRLRAALTYLAAGEPVSAAGRRVGYTTPSAFVAAFRRETGLTPATYFGSDHR
ncbi:MAG: AraC family transcriptional regulator [Streptosporangiales bacterium]